MSLIEEEEKRRRLFFFSLAYLGYELKDVKSWKNINEN